VFLIFFMTVFSGYGFWFFTEQAASAFPLSLILTTQAVKTKAPRLIASSLTEIAHSIQIYQDKA